MSGGETGKPIETCECIHLDAHAKWLDRTWIMALDDDYWNQFPHVEMPP